MELPKLLRYMRLGNVACSILQIIAGIVGITSFITLNITGTLVSIYVIMFGIPVPALRVPPLAHGDGHSLQLWLPLQLQGTRRLHLLHRLPGLRYRLGTRHYRWRPHVLQRLHQPARHVPPPAVQIDAQRRRRPHGRLHDEQPGGRQLHEQEPGARGQGWTVRLPAGG
ncbi:Golgi apparatus membrane protein TVP15 [Phytophthora cactorum]|nr:Golgi apparatus membrane protein TVP15 [Phytophthora cactorum]